MVSEQTVGVLLALFAAICWGSGASLYKIVLKSEHSLFLTITIRGSIAVPFIAIVTFFVTGFYSIGILLSPKVLPILILSSLCVGFGDLIFFGSLQRIEVSKAMPVASIYPLFTAILLILFGVETISTVVIIGIFILILGLGLLAQQDVESLTNVESKDSMKAGLTLAVLAAIFWSFGITTLSIILEYPGIDVYSLATIRFGLLTLLFGLLWMINSFYRHYGGKIDPTSLSHLSKRDGFVLGLGGIITWGIGAVSFFSSIEMIGAARATPISSINPLASFFVGIFILKERLSPLQVVGVLLIIFGSIFVSIQQI
ncbi:MAG: DMT family transporter [Candidatus Heimdallarchaeota archaeon]|nr:MAG: DMT family transporter [Candidatus Heimdallarchaeota archaeon]